MCGIAGLIHRGKSSNVGSELQGMLQALKHRGEDSTGYALYGDTDGKNFIMRFKVGENVGEGSSSIVEDVSVYDESCLLYTSPSPRDLMRCIKSFIGIKMMNGKNF